jgi:hypothetical protein
MSDETVEQLDAKIAEHNEQVCPPSASVYLSGLLTCRRVAQLEQVNQLLALTPNDESLLKLQSDIQQVLAITYDLRKLKTVIGTFYSLSPLRSPSVIHPLPLILALRLFVVMPAPASASSSSQPSTAQSKTMEGPPPLPSSASSASSSASASAASAAASVASGSAGKWQLKQRCMAQWTDGKYYSARIDSITEINTFRVTFLDYGNTHEVTLSQLQPYLHAPAVLLKPDVLVRAVWPEDGLFYDAKIEGNRLSTGAAPPFK